MAKEDVIRSQKVGFIGVGNLGQAVLRAFLDSGLILRQNVIIANRTEKKLQKVAEDFSVRAASTNEQVVDESGLIVLAMKPQDLYQAIEPIASSFHSEQVIFSLAAGITLASLRKLLPNAKKIIRVMPNTAAKVRKSVIGYAATKECEPILPWCETLLGSMGIVVPVDDGEMIESITVGSSSGIGFVFELMIYWKEWLEERGIEPETARKITVQVFSGASALAEFSATTSLDELQRKVTSIKGVTAAGLDSMRELEIERALRISFEKAALRDKELGQNWVRTN